MGLLKVCLLPRDLRWEYSFRELACLASCCVTNQQTPIHPPGSPSPGGPTSADVTQRRKMCGYVEEIEIEFANRAE
jgi:hypothetical protein